MAMTYSDVAEKYDASKTISALGHDDMLVS